MYYCTYLRTFFFFFLETLISIQKTLSPHKTISKNYPWLKFAMLQIYGATLFGIIIMCIYLYIIHCLITTTKYLLLSNIPSKQMFLFQTKILLPFSV